VKRIGVADAAMLWTLPAPPVCADDECPTAGSAPAFMILLACWPGMKGIDEPGETS
jgi:hypothetical protein